MDPLNEYVKIDYNASRYAALLKDTMAEGIKWPTKAVDQARKMTVSARRRSSAGSR